MNTYRAYVMNEQGAGEFAGSASSLNELKKDVRRRYGPGWTVTIEKYQHDGDDGWFPPVQVAKFKLRK